MSLWLGRVLNDCQLKQRRFINSTAPAKEVHLATRVLCSHSQQTPQGHMETSEVWTWAVLSLGPPIFWFSLTLSHVFVFSGFIPHKITSHPQGFFFGGGVSGMSFATAEQGNRPCLKSCCQCFWRNSDIMFLFLLKPTNLLIFWCRIMWMTKYLLNVQTEQGTVSAFPLKSYLSLPIWI